MGFFGKLFSAVGGVAVLPVAVVRDVVDVVEPDSLPLGAHTEHTVRGVAEDLGGALDDLIGGDWD